MTSVTALLLTSSTQSKVNESENNGCQVRGDATGSPRTPSPATRQPRSGGRMQPTAQAVGGVERKITKPQRGERNMSHTCGNILLHMIFSTRGRLPLIKSDFRADLFAYTGGIIREMDGTALIVNGTADHVHMLLRIRPAQSSAQIVRVVKANSSRWVREKWSRELDGRRGTAYSANRMLRRSGNISPGKRSIIGSFRFRRSLLRFLGRITLPMMNDTSGINLFRPSGAR